MNKITVLATLLLLTLTSTALSADFKVDSVNRKAKQAVLIDQKTGAKLQVKEGDRVNGAVVHEIRETHVTVITPIDEHNGVAAVIPTPKRAVPPAVQR